MSGDSAVTVGVEMWLSGYPGEGYLFRPPVRRYACQWKNGCFIIKCFILCVRGAFRDRCEVCAPVCELAPAQMTKCWDSRRLRGLGEVFRGARRIGLAFGLRKLHRAGAVDGYCPGGRLLLVHLQSETANVFAAVDGGLGAVCAALRRAGAGSVCAIGAYANGAGSLAVRAGGFVFFPGRATVCAA